jgi:3-hydroxyacyl-[acyl-carrier-protein] dehydratase
MIVGADQITTLIPQRAPFVMISSLLDSDLMSTSTSFEIKPDNIFVENGLLTEPALIENMAQTAAAGVGYQFSLKNEPVPPGFIGAIKNLEIKTLPQVGQMLLTKVEILQEVFGVTLIKGSIAVDHETIASCEMKIVLQKNEA